MSAKTDRSSSWGPRSPGPSRPSRWLRPMLQGRRPAPPEAQAAPPVCAPCSYACQHLPLSGSAEATRYVFTQQTSAYRGKPITAPLNVQSHVADHPVASQRSPAIAPCSSTIPYCWSRRGPRRMRDSTREASRRSPQIRSPVTSAYLIAMIETSPTESRPTAGSGPNAVVPGDRRRATVGRKTGSGGWPV